MEPEELARLAKCALAGDKGSKERLAAYVSNTARIHVVRARRGGTGQGYSGDIGQVAWMRFWSCINREGVKENGSLEALICRIATNLLVDQGRRLGKEKPLPVEMDVQDQRSGPSGPVRREEGRKMVLTLLSQLKQCDRELVYEHLYEEKTFAEIAKNTSPQASEKSLRMRYHRVLKKLRKHKELRKYIESRG